MSEGSDRFTLTSHDDNVIVLAGELDAHTAPTVEAALADVDDTDTAVLDMSGLTFIDSSGLRVLISAHRDRAEAGGALHLRNPSRSVQRLLSISGLEGHLVVESDTAPD